MKIIHAPDKISIMRPGQAEPILVQNAPKDHRPFIHPIIAPDGMGVITENEPSHHPWQHGLYTGLNQVNGLNFWTEGKILPTWTAEQIKKTSDPEFEGTFHPYPLEKPEVHENSVQWKVEALWKKRRETPVLLETQEWKFKDKEDCYEIDMNWTLHAEVDITFGKYPYGGLYFKMPYRHNLGGSFLSSEGVSNPKAAEQQRARWIANSIKIEGRSNGAGIAVMDHPENPEYPSPWRVDNFLGFLPSRSIAGDWRLSKGEACCFKYRIFVFCGGINTTKIEEIWKNFSPHH